MLLNPQFVMILRQAGVQPQSDAGQTGVDVDGHPCRAIQKLARVEDVVDFLVLHQTVGVDAGTGHVEVGTHERRAGRDLVADFLFKILADLGDHRQIHSVGGAPEGGVFDDHGLQRAVARPLTDAEEGAVHTGCAVQPGGGRIGNHLVEIVVTVPFQLLRCQSGIVIQTVDDTLHAAGQSGALVIHAVAHGVAGTDLHGDTRFLTQLTECLGEGHHKSVKIRTGDVLKVAAGADAHIQGALDHAQIFIHSGGTGQTHLIINMIVGAGHEDARFLDAQGFNQLEILLGGTDPGGDFGEVVSQIHTLGQGLSVLLGVYEEFALADQSLGTAQAVHQFIQIGDLLDSEGGGGLLSVPEGGVGDPDVLRHLHGNETVVEGHLRYGFVIKQIPLEIGRLPLLQGVAVGGLLNQIGLGGEFHLDVAGDGVVERVFV